MQKKKIKTFIFNKIKLMTSILCDNTCEGILRKTIKKSSIIFYKFFQAESR